MIYPKSKFYSFEKPHIWNIEPNRWLCTIRGCYGARGGRTAREAYENWKRDWTVRPLPTPVAL
jgi:hypothetical protein